MNSVFSGVTFCLNTNTEFQISNLKELLEENGGTVVQTVDSNLNFVICGENLAITPITKMALKYDVPLVQEIWVRNCIKRGKILPTTKYLLVQPESKQDEEAENKAKWFWQSDDGWVRFNPQQEEDLETGFENKENEVKIDEQRFADLKDMFQRRYDNINKIRPIKRELPSSTSEPSKSKAKFSKSSKEEKEEEEIKTVAPISTTSNNNNNNLEDLFEGMEFLFLNEEQDLTEELTKDIEKRGGFIVHSVHKASHVVTNVEPTIKQTTEIQELDLLVVTPQYLYDCINQGKKLEESDYTPGKFSLKRKAEENDEEESNNQSSAKWFWQSDSGWKEYLPQLTSKIEKAFMLKANQVKVDTERYVDLQTFHQCRYDDPSKKRPVKREAPDQKKNPNKKPKLDPQTSLQIQPNKKVIQIPDSKLDRKLADLIALICDLKMMKNTLLEYEIDVNRMPLGKLSKSQINKGYQILKEIEEILSKPSSKMEVLLTDCTNRFYTAIPHAFLHNLPPKINNKKILKEKIEMLESLADMEIASKILSKGLDLNSNPLDDQYASLHCELEPMDHNADEFKMIQRYVSLTHAPTHNTYTLEVLDVFAVNREGESEGFKKFKDFPNRQLLWHGSRLTNWAGILSTGLRIAPPEAPITGYMFGKGLYFADLSSKSANYCHTSKEQPIGLLLLAEVALGTMYLKREAEMITKLKAPYNSTKGEGQYTPDPSTFETLPNGCVVPCGKPISSGLSNTDTELLYNEFIVYDVNQVNLRYLVKLKFKFK